MDLTIPTDVLALKKSDGSIKYFGRSEIIPKGAAKFQQLVDLLSNNYTAIAKTAQKDALWQGLADDVKKFNQYFMESDAPMREYQIDILTDAILPYIDAMVSRFHFDKQRFIQISHIFESVRQSENRHPIVLLNAIDPIVGELKSSSYLFKSTLLVSLERAVLKQWRPILSDYQATLQNMAGKLLFLGVVGVIGWQIAMMYPMYRIMLTLFRIVEEWEKAKRISPNNIFGLVKSCAIMFAITNIVQIISIYSSFGYACLLAGVAAGVTSSNDELTKLAIPMIASHITHIDYALSKISSTDSFSLTSIMNMSKTMHHDRMESEAVPNACATDDRVEELPSDPTSDTGVRQRKHDASTSSRNSGAAASN